MPDITMCMQDQCPLAKLCYRNQAIQSEHQYVTLFPYTEEGCEYFMEMYHKKFDKDGK